MEREDRRFGRTDPAEKESWTLDITPRRPVFDLRIAELRRYRDLIVLLVHRDLVSTYKQTVLGPLWIVLQPLLTTVVFTVIFGNVAGLSTDGIPGLVFYMTGVTCWIYFSACLTRSAAVFADNAYLFSKVYFPRLVVPLSIAVSNLVRFCVHFALLVVMLVVYRDDPRLDIHLSGFFLVPGLVLILVLISLGLGLIFSAVTRTYRDLRHLLQFGVQLLMYATPVIYPLSSLPERYRTALSWNPVAPVIETFRFVTTGAGRFDAGALVWSIGFALAALLVGIVAFNRAEAEFLDTV